MKDIGSRGRGAQDEIEGSDKQGESDYVIETKLGFTS
jgi:hypothetical protein